MECFKSKLLEEKNYAKLYSQDKMALKRILKELDGGPVGIGATGLYKLDYAFTAQVIELIQIRSWEIFVPCADLNFIFSY